MGLVIEYFVSKLGVETKNMRLKREYSERLSDTEQAIRDIRETSKTNVDMFIEHEKKVVAHFEDVKDEITKQLTELNNKFDEQQIQIENRLEVIDADGKRRDCTVFRDRLVQGLRHFSQNKDENGNVHISMSDYESMSKMFEEYDKAGGNGLVKHLKETEFDKFIVDTERKF